MGTVNLGITSDRIRYSGQVFDTDCDECVSCDTCFAGGFQQLATSIKQLAQKITAVRDSFCPTVGIVDWDTLLAVKSQMSGADQAVLADLMVAAMLETFFDENSNLDKSAVLDLFLTVLDNGSDIYYQVLLAIHMAVEL